MTIHTYLAASAYTLTGSEFHHTRGRYPNCISQNVPPYRAWSESSIRPMA